MKIVVIDGQGGKMGSTIIAKTINRIPDLEIYAIGTNSMATAAMIKAGAKYSATGENPVVVNSKDADIIIGPIGIINVNSYLGEISASMVLAITSSSARKILIPYSKCNVFVAGTGNDSMDELMNKAIDELVRCIGK
ncbi:MAG: DUF3842 family protein [Erysipelotrichaceae bacterium]|nr:DUF3842 family protein [Erysipelotrichaceae bacterium]MBR0462719.1 DUF3842 family protein [Erysipelotrichaceae bacterium]